MTHINFIFIDVFKESKKSVFWQKLFPMENFLNQLRSKISKFFSEKKKGQSLWFYGFGHFVGLNKKSKKQVYGVFRNFNDTY